MKIAHVVMAGGRGRRLRPFTWYTPKALLPFGKGRRLIDDWIDGVVAHRRMTDVIPIVLMGYRRDAVLKYVRKRLPDAIFLDAAGVGSGGGLIHHWQMMVETGADLIIVSPCDHHHRIDFARLADYHIATQADVTLVSVTSSDPRHDYISVSGEYVRLTARPSIHPGAAYTGVVALSVQITEKHVATLRPPADLTNDIVRPLLVGSRVAIYHESEPWEDLGTWPRYLTHLITHRRRRRE